MGQLPQEGRGSKPPHFSGFLRQRIISCSHFTRCGSSPGVFIPGPGIHSGLDRAVTAKSGRDSVSLGGDGCCFHRGSTRPRAQAGSRMPSPLMGKGEQVTGDSTVEKAGLRRALRGLPQVSLLSPGAGASLRRRKPSGFPGPASPTPAAGALHCQPPGCRLEAHGPGPAPSHHVPLLPVVLIVPLRSPDSSFLPHQGRWPSRVCARSPLLDGCASWGGRLPSVVREAALVMCAE